MTGEELSALIKDEIGEDARLHTILDRIRDGKANLTDSELYAAITARITAQQMRQNVLSLDKREAAFVGITRERYTDTFTVFSAVQRILDAENGIHIRPKEPGFDTGRARKIGHSLEDRTVPDSTIERRARSATENFCMSHHDDCMRANAEFRARAGLQSYAIRDGSAKCCDWCADVSGKYPANETPAGFWGRHDNCKCSILYESKRSGRQLLRGAKDNTRRWEVVPENAGAEPLVRLTHEQAAAIQERNRLTVLTHEQTMTLQAEHQLSYLTGGVKSGRIKAIQAENYAELEQELLKLYNVELKVPFSSFDFSVFKETLDAFEVVSSQYPEIANSIRDIRIMRSADVLSFDGEIMRFNSLYFSNDIKLKATCAKQSESKFWIKDSSPASLMIHEAAHAVERLLINLCQEYKYDFERDDAWKACSEAKKIVTRAVSEILETEHGRGKTEHELRQELSRYSLQSYSETMAEAFADVFVHGENANPLSIRITEITHEQYEQYKKMLNGVNENDG